MFTTSQLAAVFFNSQDRAEHRLRQLTQARVLARFRPHRRHCEGSAPYHYVLGPLGAAILAAEHDEDLRRVGYRQDKTLALAHSHHLAHLVGINGFFTTPDGLRPPPPPPGRHRGCAGGVVVGTTLRRPLGPPGPPRRLWPLARR